MKGQVSIQYILLLSAVIVVSIVLFYAYTHVIGKAEIKPVKTLISYSFSNVNGGNSSFTTITNSNFTKNTVLPVEVRLFFPNNTIIDVNASYVIRTKLNMTDGKYYYIFNTTTFPVLTKNLTSVMAQLLFVRSNKNYTEPLANTSSKITLYNMNYYNKLPYYLFSLQAVPANSGTFSPNASGYYKAGTKLSILAVNTSKYGFLKWYGIGNGSYSGTSQLATVEVNSNITEYGYFAQEINVSFSSNYNGETFTLNGKSYSLPLVKKLLVGDFYTFSYSSSYSLNNYLYVLKNISVCNTTILKNTYTLYANYSKNNCKIKANYIKETPIYFNFSNPNSGYEITAKYENGTVFAQDISTNSSYYIPVNSQIFVSTSKENNGQNYLTFFSNFTGTGPNSVSTTSQSFSTTVVGPITEKENLKTYKIVAQLTFTNNGQEITNPNIFININTGSGINYNGNYANFYFAFENQTFVPSWIFMNKSGVLTIMLKLPIQMASGESVSVYLENISNYNTFASQKFEIGEFPSLSSQYGEYDNGREVMPVYYNFAGSSSSLPNGLSDAETSNPSSNINNFSIKTDNGIYLTDYCGNGYGCSSGIDIYTSSKYPSGYTLLTEIKNGGSNAYTFGASNSIAQYVPYGGLGSGTCSQDASHSGDFGNPSILGPGYYVWSQGGAPGGISYWTGSSYGSIIGDCYGTPEFVNFTWSGDYINASFSNQSSQYFKVQNTNIPNQQNIYYYVGIGDDPGKPTMEFSYFALANFGDISYSIN